MTEGLESLVQAAAAAAREAVAHDGAWSAGLRQAAVVRLESDGLPGPGDESWRFTPLRGLQSASWEVAPVAGGFDIDPSIPGLDAARIVLVDGRLSEELSDFGALPASAEVLSASADDSVRVNFRSREVEGSSHGFEYLNTAAMPDPVVLRIHADGGSPAPIHLVHLSSDAEARRIANPRLRVELDRNAEAIIIEDHLCGSGNDGLVNLCLDIQLGENAGLEWTRLVRTGPAHSQLARVDILQDRSSRLRMHSMTLGGALVRHDVDVVLAGEGAECGLFGLVVGAGKQIADNHSVLRHRASNTRSEEGFRNVLDGQARAVFAGRVVVEEGVTGTDAQQSNANLLLSGGARVDALPQLEIYNDDVKASHGSTLGQLDEDSLFYLRSRGIDEGTGRAMLTYAFANAVVEGISLAPVRALVRRSVFDLLPEANLDEAILEDVL